MDIPLPPRLCMYSKCGQLFRPLHSNIHYCCDGHKRAAAQERYRAIFKGVHEKPPKRFTKPKPVLCTEEEQRAIDDYARNSLPVRMEYRVISKDDPEFKELAQLYEKQHRRYRF